jgi:hypothetical protein
MSWLVFGLIYSVIILSVISAAERCSTQEGKVVPIWAILLTTLFLSAPFQFVWLIWANWE